MKCSRCDKYADGRAVWNRNNKDRPMCGKCQLKKAFE